MPDKSKTSWRPHTFVSSDHPKINHFFPTEMKHTLRVRSEFHCELD